MKISALISFFYALLIIVGGAFAYSKAHSTASLAMSLTAGAILIVTSFLTYQGNLTALFAILATIASLCFVFIIRFALSGKMWPPGFLAIISVAALILIISAWLFEKK